MLIGLFGIATNASISPPSGMTERVETTQSTGPRKVATEIADQLLGCSGATGNRGAAASRAGVSIGRLLALRPA